MKPLNFRPSCAHRWLSCPGEPWVRAAIPGTSSVYADEGTAAHEVLSNLLTGTEPKIETLDKLGTEGLHTVQECAELVKDYAELLGYELRSEVPIGLRLNDATLKGTADVVLLGVDDIVVLDYKHGAGRKVSAIANPQLTLYALMVRYTLGSKLPLKIGVLQPNGVGEGLDLWDCDEEYLVGFKIDVAAAIARAEAFPASMISGFNRGPWCWGCVGKEENACPVVMLDNVLFAAGAESLDDREWIEFMRPEESVDTPKKISNWVKKMCAEYPEKETLIKTFADAGFPSQQIDPPWWMLDHKDMFATIAKNLGARARDEIEAGKKIPGWATDWKKGQRSWIEPDEVPEILSERTGKPVDVFRKEEMKTKIVGITDALKICKGVAIEDLMKTPSTRVLVRESEKGLELDEVE